MSNFNKKLSKRLQLNHAYGQLIALIFVPIMVLASVGTVLVLNETSAAAKSQQRHTAAALLTRYEHTASNLLELVERRPEQYDQAQRIMQNMFNERYLKRAAIIDQQGRVYLSIGYRDTRFWPQIPNMVFFGPVTHNHNNIYGQRIQSPLHQAAWLVVEMDNQPLQIAHYRVFLVLIVTGLITLLLLLLCLNFYSRRWIAPMYEIRMQLQRLKQIHLTSIWSLTVRVNYVCYSAILPMWSNVYTSAFWSLKNTPNKLKMIYVER